MEVTGRRVTLMGLGRHGGGVGAARYLVAQGARLTVTDRAGPEQLADSLAALEGHPVARWRLGGHDRRDFLETDLVVVNPAVLPGDPFVFAAAGAGVPITTEIELFLARCPARIAAVTGSNGKSSTTSMLASILSAAGHRVWLGGNIGRSLLEDLPAIGPDDDVVLELSSFQLARLGRDTRGVDLAVITNCTPNHLDWHGSYGEYRRAKQRLLQMQPATGIAILNDDDAEVAGWRTLARGSVVPPLVNSRIPALNVPGTHQRANARLAAAAAIAWGADQAALEEGLRQFTGLPHRLARVREIEGRTFFDDSLSTTPESTIAGLRAFAAPVWLLAGGYDKGADFAALADAIVARAAGAAFYGATADQLHAAVAQRDPEPCCTRVATLLEALEWCWRQSRRGDVLLLSPACASYDQFRDYADRAEHFQRCIDAVCRGAVV